MPTLRLASVALEPLVLRERRPSRARLRCVWNGVEHVRDGRPMSRLQPSVAMDVMPAMRRVVVPRRLVRSRRRVAALFSRDPNAFLAHPRGRITGSRAGIVANWIVNCWTLDRLLAWIPEPARERIASQF